MIIWLFVHSIYLYIYTSTKYRIQLWPWITCKLGIVAKKQPTFCDQCMGWQDPTASSLVPIRTTGKSGFFVSPWSELFFGCLQCLPVGWGLRNMMFADSSANCVKPLMSLTAAVVPKIVSRVRRVDKQCCNFEAATGLWGCGSGALCTCLRRLFLVWIYASSKIQGRIFMNGSRKWVSSRGSFLFQNGVFPFWQ